MANQKPQDGQSNYDMTMQLYGNLDLTVQLANDSNIEDLSIISSLYNYDPTNIKINSNFTGYIYSTDYNHNVNICQIPSGFEIIKALSTYIIFRWNNSIGLSFQYAFNTTGEIPVNWTDTTSSIATISGLLPNTDYFIFLRTKCNSDLYSSYQVISQKSIERNFNDNFNFNFN